MGPSNLCWETEQTRQFCHWLDANQDLHNDIEAPLGGHPAPAANPEPNLSL